MKLIWEEEKWKCWDLEYILRHKVVHDLIRENPLVPEERAAPFMPVSKDLWEGAASKSYKQEE